MEGVDRNLVYLVPVDTSLSVALLMEGVDRNPIIAVFSCPSEVALLMEGVDRNYFTEDWFREMPMSPSSWRAWIEILLLLNSPV